MLDINIYNSIYNWTKAKLTNSFSTNSNAIDIYAELMPPSKTQAIVISKNSFGNTLETYIDGSCLASCEMSIVAVQKLGSYTESEIVELINQLDNALSQLIETFDSDDKPQLQSGYSIKSMEVSNNTPLKQLDINTVVYSIDVIFKIACQNNM